MPVQASGASAPAPPPSGIRLFTDKTTPLPPRACLDANAVFDVWEHELAMAGRRNRQKHSDLIGCLARLRAARTELFVTPHIVEEFFHVTTQGLMRPLYTKHGITSEKRLRKIDGPAHQAARISGLKVLDEAIGALAKHGVRMLLAVGEEPPSPASLGQEAFDAFRAFLHACVEIGGKDAIHLSIAGLLDCTAFISRDGDFHQVKDILIYTDKAPPGASPAAPSPSVPKAQPPTK